MCHSCATFGRLNNRAPIRVNVFEQTASDLNDRASYPGSDRNFFVFCELSLFVPRSCDYSSGGIFVFLYVTGFSLSINRFMPRTSEDE